MSTKASRIAVHLVAALLLATVASAQGIKCKRSAVVLFGSAANCSQPATIDYRKVQKATPEYKTIKSDGVQKGSARYELLTSAMNSRIKRAVRKAAEAESRDCVVRKGDIKNARGLTVTNLTSSVLDELGT